MDLRVSTNLLEVDGEPNAETTQSSVEQNQRYAKTARSLGLTRMNLERIENLGRAHSGNVFKQIDGVTFNAIAIAITSTSTVAVTVIERWATQESASWVI